MGRLTRDRTAKPLSRDQILKREQGRKVNNRCFFFQLKTSKIGNHTRLIHTLLKVLTMHTRTTLRRRAARMLACHIMELLLPECKSLGKSADYHLGVSELFIPPLCLALVSNLLIVFSYKYGATSPSQQIFFDRCHIYFYTTIVFCADTVLRRSYPTVSRNMGVTSEMEEQVTFRLFQVYIRYYSPRPNLLLMESLNLPVIRFI